MTTVPYNYKGVMLEAPASYIAASDEQRQKICNGIGPQWAAIGGPVNTLMMAFNYVLGLNCKVVGDIHDWMYCYSEASNTEKNEADLVLLCNGYRWITANTKWNWLCVLRKKWMTRYYKTVVDWGYKAFYDRYA